jgi:hypothetical protein
MCEGYGRATALTVSRRPLTTEARVQRPARPYGEQWQWDRLFAGISLSVPCHQCPTLIHLSLN